MLSTITLLHLVTVLSAIASISGVAAFFHDFN